MKKIKISELPLYQSLKGLFVMGTDSNNRSVKVNLEYIDTTTSEAIKQANAAATAAAQAKEKAEQATKSADEATKKASDAADAADKATKDANEAAQTASNAAGMADKAKKDADAAAEAANKAKAAADVATKSADEATAKAQAATEAATQATETVLNTLGILVPTSLAVECLKRITLGNLAPIYIRATLTPATAMQNLIFLSDNKAVTVAPNGLISVVGKGVSVVHIIPTCNTALAKSVQIEVGEPTMRLVNTRKQMRFTSGGAIRLN